MSLADILYKLIIGPLELLFEVIFVVANRKVSNPAIAIVVLSLTMNFLVLPLYKRADELQEEERAREQKMRPWINHIKKTFKGDERFMMLQAYYRQNNYKPTDALKGSISLLLEIPFFIAAYRFLSGLEILKGVSFGPILDLGAPDAMISIGSVQINILPILMTLINLISASIYMKGMPLKNKIQMFGIAGIFLVLLYRSPAGLVFYWTLNNIFSLLKNIVYRFRAPKCNSSDAANPSSSNDIARKLFMTSTILLTVVTGLLCPSAVIGDSVGEFVDYTNYISPNWYVVSALLLAVGTFIIWFRIFFELMKDSVKTVMSVLTAILSVAGIANYMFFSNGYGILSPDLQYNDTLKVSLGAILVNSLAVTIIACIVVIIWKRKPKTLTLVLAVSCMSILIMSGLELVSINTELQDGKDMIKMSASEEPEFIFSRNGKNVFVIMMDRMAGYYIPFIIQERPELKDKFDGFTYFENVVSHASSTNEATPALYGGYDYTPTNINKRDSESLVSKNDEALNVMPEIFSGLGFNVTICDPTNAGYKPITDFGIYSNHPEYKTYHLNGRFALEEYGYFSSAMQEQQAKFRNFYCYGLFRISPTAFHRTLYQRGRYNSADSLSSISNQETDKGGSVAHGYSMTFMKHFATLCNLDSITKVTEENTNNFIIMTNDSTHEPMILQEPEYLPAVNVDNIEYDETHPNRIDEKGNVYEFISETDRKHYQINIASMTALGEWLDLLKEKGVYDNSRIIIVSDHGTAFRKEGPNTIYYTDEDTGEERNIDTKRFRCTLLYKDFDSKGFVTSDNFVTNADVPFLALNGITDNMVNPFTGNEIVQFKEDMLPLQVAFTDEENGGYDININNGNVFMKSNWFEVIGGDVSDVNNWKYIGNR